VPSLREALGVVTVQAMSYGKLVVASDVGAMREAVVPGETGLLVPAGDVPALASALETALSDSGLRTRLGAAARRLVQERFSLDAFVAGSLDVYRSAVTGGGG
jgi:glycosyltransferase involved in cell wall biosynthesis